MSKSDDYKELIAAVKSEYQTNEAKYKTSKVILSFQGEVADLCEEINLWTYWQGRNYAINTPEIDYLIVGQDWGNPDLEKNAGVKERINLINADKSNTDHINYIDLSDTDNYETDLNMAVLFKELGIGTDSENIMNTLYPNVFFTNFCLGYRCGDQGESGNMTKKLMMENSAFFKRLVEILEPKRIICLGKLTFECVFETLIEEKASKLKNFKSDYNIFLDSSKGFPEDNPYIFPVAHCGAMGTMNRNKSVSDEELKKVNRTKKNYLEYQKADWSKAKIIE